MIIPKYWAEAKLPHPQRSETIRRFGWSDDSPEAARAHAESRASEAIQRMLQGEALPRREPRVLYNGAEGVPIREEIVERQGEAIVTRNGYGARCLNVPDVLFADLDFPEGPSKRLFLGVLIVLSLVAIVVGVATGRVWVGLLQMVAAVLVAPLLATFLHQMAITLRGGPEGAIRARVSRFLRSRPDWNVRLYRTPGGFRLLAMHRLFATDDPDLTKYFKEMGADPIYATMCLRQQCFRARVSAKPWRIGIKGHIQPDHGGWPFALGWEAPRAAWVAHYENTAQNFAACRYTETLGTGITHPDAQRLQIWHDALCRAESGLPIA